MQPTNARMWVIAAQLNQIDTVCKEIEEWLIEKRLEKHIFAFQILVREALNNAVLHGCGEKADQQVRCELDLQEDSLHLKVTDPGPGFNWQALIQQRMAPNNQVSGRGLWLYRMYADRIEFNLSGNCVELVRFKDHTGHGRPMGS